jgi:hypothetical protein
MWNFVSRSTEITMIAGYWEQVGEEALGGRNRRMEKLHSNQEFL